METNPYDYDRSIPWIPQQNQSVEDTYLAAPSHRLYRPAGSSTVQQYAEPGRDPHAPARMSKMQSLALVSVFKRWLIVASVLGFGAFSGLVAYHQANAATNSQPSADPSQAAPDQQPGSGGFFDQHQGGNNFGPGNSMQQPMTGSGVS